MSIRHASWIVAAGVAALFANGANAGQIFYNETPFMSAIVGSVSGTDRYDDLTDGAERPSNLQRMAGPLAYSATAPDGLWAGASSDGFLTNNNRLDAITLLTFAPGIHAFGANFFSSDFDSNPFVGETIQITVQESNGQSFTTDLTDPLLHDTSRELTYFGYLADSAIASVSFIALGPHWPSIDNLTLASNPVPEPSTLSLLGLSLAAVAAARRRRQPAG